MLQGYCRSVVVSRQDEGDADGDYEEEEQQSQQNQAGVLDIIGGAFTGDLNKILKGSFSFTDKQIGEALIPKITGEKPPPKKKPSAAAGATSKAKDEDEGEK